jgi:hypothetical protein
MTIVFSCSLLALAAPAAAASPPVKEPVYRQPPRYCLLVFGPGAKTRVWLVLDGDVLYADRNGDGDLTQAGERFPLPRFRKSLDEAYAESREVVIGDVTEGGLRHTRLTLAQYRVRPDFLPWWPWHRQLRAFVKENPGSLVYELSVAVERRPRPGDEVRIAGRFGQSAGRDAAGFLQFAARPQDAPVVHFNGPLRMGLWCPQELPRGKAGDLVTVIGTPGAGKGTFAVIDPSGLILDDVHPVAEIEFPPAGAGAGPIRSRVTLPFRVEVTHFYGPVPVPGAAGDGKARIKLSLDACREVRVGPARVEVPLGPRKPEKSGD